MLPEKLFSDRLQEGLKFGIEDFWYKNNNGYCSRHLYLALRFNVCCNGIMVMLSHGRENLLFAPRFKKSWKNCELKPIMCVPCRAIICSENSGRLNECRLSFQESKV